MTIGTFTLFIVLGDVSRWFEGFERLNRSGSWLRGCYYFTTSIHKFPLSLHIVCKRIGKGINLINFTLKLILMSYGLLELHSLDAQQNVSFNRAQGEHGGILVLALVSLYSCFYYASWFVRNGVLLHYIRYRVLYFALNLAVYPCLAEALSVHVLDAFLQFGHHLVFLAAHRISADLTSSAYS